MTSIGNCKQEMQIVIDMHKRIIILKACGSSGEPHECNRIYEQAQLYGIESVCKCVKDNEDLESILYSHGLFDYIYLSAHGNSEGFASEDGKVKIGRASCRERV